ncbi:hypothetical protein Dimus_018127 [Dionaea muscipula]
MGKIVDDLESQQRGWDGTSNSSPGSSSSSRNFFCPMGLSRFAHHCNLKCLLVLILSLSIFLPVLFLLLPFHRRDQGFDASADVKAHAAVQAYFRLEKPTSQLIPYIEQLEDELSGEIGVPDTRIVVLSMHQSGAPNWTDIVFGVLPDPINAPVNPVSLSVLKSCLIDLFLLQSNLTLTSSIFGRPSSFQLLKFAGGITIIPAQSISMWEMPQVLFNFGLSNSISDIKENLAELKQQLKGGLNLRSSEFAYVQVTNVFGSTTNPPVTVQATVLSDMGRLVPGRLRQLAKIIQSSSPSRNLGLNDTVFGEVNSISLSSYLESTIDAASPEPAQAPCPTSSDPPCQLVSPSPDPTTSQGSPCPTSSNPPKSLTGSPTPSPSLPVHQRSSPALAFSPYPSIDPSSSPSPFCFFHQKMTTVAGLSKGIQLVSYISVIFHYLHLVR